MTPYEEPYQSRYQKRRLGALGIEWRPSSLRLAIGPDLSLDPVYQMLPLADLDVLIEPLPEFTDVMEWEPENPVQSDDNDSEYNITEENSSRGEQGSLDFDDSDDSECSAEDSGGDDSNKDIRRSKRRKQKAEASLCGVSNVLFPNSILICFEITKSFCLSSGRDHDIFGSAR